MGALHHANVWSGEDRHKHNQMAIMKYGEIILELGRTLGDGKCRSELATRAVSWLHCVFEMIGSGNVGSKARGSGARPMISKAKIKMRRYYES